jgi:hypothetical protein
LAWGGRRSKGVVSPQRIRAAHRKARRKAKGFMACTAALALTASDVLILLDSYVEILRGADYAPLRMTVAFASRGYRDGSTRTAD